MLFLLLLVWAADTGAFFVGRRFGRIRLAPQVSPSKTWEGVLGGLAAAVAVAALGASWFNLRHVAFLSLCLAVVLISIVGDLTESMFKRYAGVKDSGSIFPGHGGVLDRIDSITAAAPTFLLGLRWMEIATMKGVVVLGSTGSVGVSTLDVIARHRDALRVVALTARSNDERLFEQCVEHRPDAGVRGRAGRCR